jgi:hypothetical protein
LSTPVSEAGGVSQADLLLCQGKMNLTGNPEETPYGLLSDLAKKNTGHPVLSEFQINNK